MKSRTAIAIFTIVNKENLFEDFKNNLNEQRDIFYKLVAIYNCNGEYNAARRAYNENATIDDVKYYVFLHPDIRFQDAMALSDIIDYIEQINDFGVAGVAGARKSETGRDIVSNIVQGKQKKRVGMSITCPTSVQTIDECLFVIKRDYFINHRFSDRTGWHLYSVEYCLNALLNGKRNYVVPGRIWHISAGESLDDKYMIQLESLINEYKNRFDVICTTVKAWNTRGVSAYLYRIIYKIKQKIKRLCIKTISRN